MSVKESACEWALLLVLSTNVDSSWAIVTFSTRWQCLQLNFPTHDTVTLQNNKDELFVNRLTESCVFLVACIWNLNDDGDA